MPLNIWIDCDPGIDDAFALAMAAASRDKLHICGISTVGGNQTCRKVTENALRLSAFLGLADVPVVKGAEGPILGDVKPADDVHGDTGLGNCRLPDGGKELASENAVLYMGRSIENMGEDERITLVPTAPLTNIALLLKTFPHVKEKIQQIVLMGGSAGSGNATSYAEFNIWTDPEAAAIVFQSGIPIVMCGLDVTRQCGLFRSQMEELLESRGPVKHAFGEMLEFYFNSPSYKKRSLACIHDAVTILYLTDPQLFQGSYMDVEVVWGKAEERGRTVCRPSGQMAAAGISAGNRVFVLNQADLPEFQRILLEKLDRLEDKNGNGKGV